MRLPLWYSSLDSALTKRDRTGVIVNPKGEMKGSAIAGPVAKECVRSLSFSTCLVVLSRLVRRLISGLELPPTPEPSSKLLDVFLGSLRAEERCSVGMQSAFFSPFLGVEGDWGTGRCWGTSARFGLGGQGLHRNFDRAHCLRSPALCVAPDCFSHQTAGRRVKTFLRPEDKRVPDAAETAGRGSATRPSSSEANRYVPADVFIPLGSLYSLVNTQPCTVPRMQISPPSSGNAGCTYTSQGPPHSLPSKPTHPRSIVLPHPPDRPPFRARKSYEPQIRRYELFRRPVVRVEAE